MNPNFLEFEQPIAELEAKIEELRYVGDDTEINIGKCTVTMKFFKIGKYVLNIIQRMGSLWVPGQLRGLPGG